MNQISFSDFLQTQNSKSTSSIFPKICVAKFRFKSWMHYTLMCQPYKVYQSSSILYVISVRRIYQLSHPEKQEKFQTLKQLFLSLSQYISIMGFLVKTKIRAQSDF